MTDGEDECEMNEGFHKFLVLHIECKKNKKVCCNLLPTETSISHFKPIIAVIMEVLGMNCSIPHHL